MKLKNEELYNKYKQDNLDKYGQEILSIAERWAKYIEASMEFGYTLEETAGRGLDAVCHISGYTIFMCHGAVKILSDCWEYGEQLRTWYNRQQEYFGDGIVNPALIEIDGKGSGAMGVSKNKKEELK